MGTYPSGPFKAVSGGTALVMSQVPSVPHPKSNPAILVPINWNLPVVVFCLGRRTRGIAAADARVVKKRKDRGEYIFAKMDKKIASIICLLLRGASIVGSVMG